MSEPPGGSARPEAATLRVLLDRRAAEDAAADFLICPESSRRVGFAALRDAAAGCARRLSALGVRPGESVAFALENGYAAVLAVLGCLYGGFRASPVNLAAGPETLAYVLAHSEARVVLLGRAQEAPIRAALAGREDLPALIPCDPDSGPLWPEDLPEGALPAAPEAETEGLLIYTSGTTGRPKGVLLTQRSLLAGGRNVAEAHRLTAADRALCVLPLYHINGLCVTVMGPLVSGGSVVMPRGFSASRFWDQACGQGCTWVSLVPTLFAYLLNLPEAATPPRESLARLRFARSASAPLAPETQLAFESRYGLPVIETLGLTETAAPVLSNPLPPGRRQPGSPGRAWGNEVRIADPEQRSLPPGEAGEILVRGPNVMKGYFKDPAATAEALTGSGWLRSGDLGRMDEAGYVVVTGRLKELIIKGGENIAPREIDEALIAQPAVLEAAAFARPCPDYGQRVEACVTLKPGVAASEAELIAGCIARVGRFKAPDRVHILADLPKGPSGKIQRLKLLSLVSGAAASAI